MKKNFLTLIFVLVLFSPQSLQSKHLFIKLSLGLASGGDIKDALLTQTEYKDYISMSEERRSNLSQDVYLEIIYQLNSYISFSVGNGYSSNLLRGDSTQFSPPGISNLGGYYTLAPEFASQVIPICVSTIFSLPVTSSFYINITGGFGYYFGTFESKSKWLLSLPGFVTWEYQSWNFRGKANTIGYYMGVGFDIDLSLNMFLTVDGLYKVVNFSNIKSSGDIGQDTTLFYIRFYTGIPSADFDYRVSQVSLSGYSFRLGLKFKF